MKHAICDIKNKFKKYFRPSPEAAAQYAASSAHKNYIKINFFAALAIVLECINIFRVLVLSNAKLTTRNNRIYFTFYVVLLVFAAGVLLLQFFFKKKQRFLTVLTILASAFWVLWMTLVNVYDILAGHGTDTSIYVTAVVCLMFIQIPIRYLFVFQFGSYALFVFLIRTAISTVALQNVTCAVFVTFACIVIQYIHNITETLHTQEIRKVKSQLENESLILKNSLQKLDFIFSESDLGIFELNVKADKLTFSDTCVQEFGFLSSASYKETWDFVESRIHAQDRQNFVKITRSAIKNLDSKAEVELRYQNVSGEYAWYLVKIIFQYANQQLTAALGVIYNINRRQKYIVEMQSKLETDPLTNVLNTRALKAKTEQYISTAQKGDVLAMLMIDVDDFKAVNDSHGHPFGDKVLMRVAKTITESFDKNVLVARTGGDEFCAVLFCGESWDAAVVYPAIEQLLHKVNAIYPEKIKLTCSVGAYAVHAAVTSYDKLYKRADQELYKAKRQHKGSYSILDEATKTRT